MHHFGMIAGRRSKDQGSECPVGRVDWVGLLAASGVLIADLVPAVAAKAIFPMGMGLAVQLTA